MKKLIYLFSLILLVAGTSCGNGNGSSASEDNEQTATEFNSSDSDTEGEGETAVNDSDEDSDNSYSSSSSTSDEDFDEFLAAYEKYIDKYIALVKKAKDGDTSAMTDAASMMSEAQEYGEKLEKISGDLTPAQLAKFQKLQQKLLKAAQ